MTLWLILGAIGAAVAAILFLGSRRTPAVAGEAAEHDLAVYRAQLDELERDRERGVLEEAELESARLEVQRRLLAADTRRGKAGKKKGKAAPAGWGVSLALALAVPLGAGAVYLWLGNPSVESQPFAERPAVGAAPALAESGEVLPDVSTMMTRLRERLAAEPGDLEGWITLARSAMTLGEYEESVAAYRQAIALDGELGHLHSALGEAEILLAGGVVTAAARTALERAFSLDPTDPRTRFYLALAREQDGDLEGALAKLKALLEDAPANAPWTGGVRERAVAIASELGLDPASVVPAGPEVAMETVQSGDQAEDRIAALVARLDDDPKDYQGWIELARLRAGLGDREGAQAALAQGSEVYAGAPFVLQQLQQAAAELGLAESETATRGPTAEDVEAAAEMSPEDQQEMIRGMVAGLAARLADEPDDAEGWRMLGRSYEVLGEPEKSAEAFGRAAELLPDDLEVQLAHATALLSAADDGNPPPPEAVNRLERVLARDPANRDALYYLGEIAQRQGDAGVAALYWERLLDQLPEGSEDHAWLKARLEALATNN